jgi:Cu2+-exporting ATPase
VLAKDGALVARFELDEDFRAGAADEIAWLRARGLEVHLLSGDRPDRTAHAAEVLGIAPALAKGGMSPGDKAEEVKALDAGDVMMVGDGLNDAPAFAEAFCAGTPAMDRPVLPARADFCFRGATAGAVRRVFEVSDLHARVVRRNLALAVAYNATTLVVCFAAAMTPLLCAVLMPISSLALVLHTSLSFERARRSA